MGIIISIFHEYMNYRGMESEPFVTGGPDDHGRETDQAIHNTCHPSG
ncbi:hypothetical protein RD1_2396 [Roseobacter denitrificans OCh 114]|uniref:Uncharacterized protein n=1 Tax=Roseobacter denitrificans (strain ATCC 33942 / OCh 114) TaxID=375451 RepID=Q166X7_ROSDO|nr:hypothetical protein RD1_2396 [Roseobacter denitrificans OCh 114]